MSHGPSTFGIIITSSRSPISVTSVVMSWSAHGDSSALTRVHSAQSPKSVSRATRTRPSRAASLRSTGTASSRLPSRTSQRAARSGSLAAIFSLAGSKKWIIRDGLSGISRIGAGAPMARGFVKSRGLRTPGTIFDWRVNAADSRPRDKEPDPMTQQANAVDTDQAAREASGAHPYGRYLEEFEVGDVYKHWP